MYYDDRETEGGIISIASAETKKIKPRRAISGLSWAAAGNTSAFLIPILPASLPSAAGPHSAWAHPSWIAEADPTIYYQSG